MPSPIPSHGWTPEAAAAFRRPAVAETPQTQQQSDIAAFYDGLAHYAMRYGLDSKEYAVEYANLCMENDHLAGVVPEIGHYIS